MTCPNCEGEADHDNSITVPAWELCDGCESVYREEFGQAESEALSAQ